MQGYLSCYFFFLFFCFKTKHLHLDVHQRLFAASCWSKPPICSDKNSTENSGGTKFWMGKTLSHSSGPLLCFLSCLSPSNYCTPFSAFQTESCVSNFLQLWEQLHVYLPLTGGSHHTQPQKHKVLSCLPLTQCDVILENLEMTSQVFKEDCSTGISINKDNFITTNVRKGFLCGLILASNVRKGRNHHGPCLDKWRNKYINKVKQHTVNGSTSTWVLICPALPIGSFAFSMVNATQSQLRDVFSLPDTIMLSFPKQLTLLHFLSVQGQKHHPEAGCTSKGFWAACEGSLIPQPTRHITPNDCKFCIFFELLSQTNLLSF